MIRFFTTVLTILIGSSAVSADSLDKYKPEGFVKWVDEKPKLAGCVEIADWCMMSKTNGKVLTALKSVTKATMFFGHRGPVHEFVSLEEDVHMEVAVFAYIKPRRSSVISKVTPEYAGITLASFDFPLEAGQEITAHTMSFTKTIVLPKGQVGIVYETFAGIDHPDCNVGLEDCQIQTHEIADAVTYIESMTGCSGDAPENNVTRIMNGEILESLASQT